MHAQDPWGTHGGEYSQWFMYHFHELGCSSLLDYGCGAGTLAAELARTNSLIDVRCYDPGVRGFEAPPQPADFVVCTDVLEHVEESFIDNVLSHIRGLMLRGGYLRCTTSPAKRQLPDGRNAHILLKPRAWWLQRLRHHGYNVVREAGGTKTVIVWVKGNS